MAAEHLVIVGKGGVGKSTTAANLSAALAEGGKRVLLVGYDSYARSSSLRGTDGGGPVPRWNDRPCQDLYPEGHGGTLSLEAGELAAGEEAGEGAALLERPLVKEFDPHFIIHDVGKGSARSFILPETVEGVARLYVVTSADMAAIHVVNEFFGWLNTISAVDCRFGGVIANKLSGPLHQSIIAHYVSETNTAIIATVSHSLRVSASDFYNRTLIEAAPSSQISFSYRKLARHILEGKEVRRPSFLSSEVLTDWAVKWGDIISELETGVVGEGGSI